MLDGSVQIKRHDLKAANVAVAWQLPFSAVVLWDSSPAVYHLCCLGDVSAGLGHKAWLQATSSKWHIAMLHSEVLVVASKKFVKECSHSFNLHPCENSNI